MAQMTMIVGSFGATAVLLYGAPQAPFSQPRCVIGGHTVSALIGSAAAFGLPPSVAAPAAVSGSLVAMMVTKTVHPPAGGTALIATLGGPKVQALGLMYGVPACVGACVMVSTATAFHALCKQKYPA